MSGLSRLETELEFLASLEGGEVVTQMTLARRISVSIGLVNALLKRAVHKGYVKAKAAPYKRYAYYLTPKGFAEKSRLVTEYLEVSLDFFRLARAEYGELFARAHACGVTRIAFVGGGELAEIALLAARDAEIEVVAILERETNRATIAGLAVVRSFDEIADVGALVITDARAPQRSFDEAKGHFAEHEILAPRLMRLTREAVELNAGPPADERQ